MAKIECSVPEELLTKTTGIIDDAARFGMFVEYRIPGSDVVVCRMEAIAFQKVNVFDGAGVARLLDADGGIKVEVEAGVVSTMPESALEKRLLAEDNANEFISAVEYRLPGTDRLVHRSADVKLKRGPEAAGAQAGGF